MKQAPPRRSDFDPIFIVGCPRSGTTLLTVLLDRHDQIAMTPETHFLSHIQRARSARVRLDRESLVDHFLVRTHFCDLRLDRDDVLRRFADDQPTFEGLFRRALEAFAARAGKSRCGEKSPEHIFDIPTLLEWFPEAKVLWLLRDGRDTVQALMRAEFFHKNRRRASHLWHSTVLAGLAAEARYPESILRVRFEDLVQDPRPELGRICDFIGVEFQEEQLVPARRSEVIPVRELGLKGRANKPLDTAKVSEYVQQTTEREKWLMDSVMADDLARLGYPPTPVRPPSPSVRARDAILNAPVALLYDPRLRALKHAMSTFYYKPFGLRRRPAWKLPTAVPTSPDLATAAGPRSEVSGQNSKSGIESALTA